LQIGPHSISADDRSLAPSANVSNAGSWNLPASVLVRPKPVDEYAEIPARYRPFDGLQLMIPLLFRNISLGKILRKTAGLGEYSHG
jgi:hypothetical protein